MTRSWQSRGKRQQAKRIERASAKERSQPSRKRLVLGWFASLLAAVLAATSPNWAPTLYGGVKGLFTSDSPSPALTVTAEPTILDDQGYSMATPHGALPSARLRQMMTKEDIATSSGFLSSVQAIGGTNVGVLSIRLVATGGSAKGVRILDIRPVNLHRTKPLDGTLFLIPSQAGNATLRMMFDLDEPVPVARQVGRPPPCRLVTKGDMTLCVPTADPYPAWFADGHQDLVTYPGSSFFDNQTISLASHEQQVLDIRAEVEKSFATFDLEIDYIVGGASGSIQRMVVSNHRQPFRVTGMSPGAKAGTLSYQAAYNLNGNFSLCSMPDAQHISLSTIDNGGCPGNSSG
jgi:hypothetical protein